MTQLFFHHVGTTGSRRDFPRSLGQKWTADKLLSPLRRDLGTAEGNRIANELDTRFPRGFNCWAPPSGAESVFDSLNLGDVVLLIGSLQLKPYLDGEFNYAGRVEFKVSEPLHETSRLIWTEARFPLIFFFDSVGIRLPWPVFLRDVGYRSNFDPHGMFYRVNPGRYSTLPGGDPAGYMQHIVSKYP